MTTAKLSGEIISVLRHGTEDGNSQAGVQKQQHRLFNHSLFRFRSSLNPSRSLNRSPNRFGPWLRQQSRFRQKPRQPEQPNEAPPPETAASPETEAPTPETPAQTFASFTFGQFVSNGESELLVTIMLDILTALEGAGVLDTVPNSVTAELLAGIPEVNMPDPPYTTIAELRGDSSIMYSIGLESISRALSDLPESVLAQVPEEDMQAFVDDIKARLP